MRFNFKKNKTIMNIFAALIIFLSLSLLSSGCSSKSKKPVETNVILEAPKETTKVENVKVQEPPVQMKEVIEEHPSKTEIIEPSEKPAESPLKESQIKKESEITAEDIFKLGVIDLQKVAEESIAGRKATDEYNSLAKLKQEVIDEKRKSIDNLRFNLEIQKAGLTEAALKKKFEEIDRLETELERFGQDSEKELESKYDELYTNMLHEILTLSSIIGEKEKYTLILDKGQILYGDEKIDITDLFIKKYDETKKPVPSGIEKNPQK